MAFLPFPQNLAAGESNGSRWTDGAFTTFEQPGAE